VPEGPDQCGEAGPQDPYLLIAAAAEELEAIVLHYDADFDLIGSVTGQRCQWVVPAGSTPPQGQTGAAPGTDDLTGAGRPPSL
jgi:hypothetical protein